MMTMVITKDGRPLIVFKEVKEFEITDSKTNSNDVVLKTIELWKESDVDKSTHSIPIKKGMDYRIFHECGCK